MNYATLADLETLYGSAELVELTDRADPPEGVVDEAVIDEALTTASAEIDGFLRARYALPLAGDPSPLLRTLCADMARFKLYKSRATEEVRQRYDDAIARLKDLSAGRMKLDVGGIEQAAAPDAIQMTSQERQFSRDRMSGF